MRRALVLLVTAVSLTGCGGAADRSEFTRLQDEVDSAARITAITVSEALTGTLPAGTLLGTGRSERCDGGASYSVATTVIHAPMDAVASLRQVATEVEREGYTTVIDTKDAVVRADVGDVTAEIRETGAGDDPSAHEIVVSTGCVDVDPDLAAELVQEPVRDVKR